MCGRYALSANPEDIKTHFQLLRQARFKPSYNIAPAQKILNIVELEDGSRKSVNLFWGLVPSWAKDRKISSHLINARMETIREKPSFRSAFKQRRCLVPATGFYEWKKQDGGKQAFYIHREDNKLFSFAALWEQWQHDTETLYSCTIITTAATELMRPIHNRMPVIISPEHYYEWLNKTASPDDAYMLLSKPSYSEMNARPVSDWVNNPTHDDERCII